MDFFSMSSAGGEAGLSFDSKITDGILVGLTSFPRRAAEMNSVAKIPVGPEGGLSFVSNKILVVLVSLKCRVELDVVTNSSFAGKGRLSFDSTTSNGILLVPESCSLRVNDVKLSFDSNTTDGALWELAAFSSRVELDVVKIFSVSGEGEL